MPLLFVYRDPVSVSLRLPGLQRRSPIQVAPNANEHEARIAHRDTAELVPPSSHGIQAESVREDSPQ
jgi:hypothetical protein